jgi:serine/threonine-protein kinase
MQLLADHMRTPPDSPSERLGASVPHELERLILRLLAKKPEDRPSSALEVRAELDAIQLEDPWTEASARAWWRHNLRDLVAPDLHEAARATTIVRDLARAA